MSEVVCQVINQPNRAEFIWSSGGGFFPPYSVEGADWKGLRDLAKESRQALATLIDSLNRGAPEPERGELAYKLVEAGAKLYNRILPSGDVTARRVRTWLEGFRKRTPALGLEVVVEEPSADLSTFLAVPWNLVYDEPALTSKAAFLRGGGTDRWRPFWAIRYNLTSGRRVEPWRRAPVWDAPKVVAVVDSTAYECLDEEARGRFDAFLAEAQVTKVGSMDELQETLQEGYPQFLYWFGHATPDYLRLGESETVTPGDLRDLFDAFLDRGRPEGMLAFLNACQTAEVGQAGSFLQELPKFGFAGAIATEHQTIDTFANTFGLDFLRGFLLEGEPLGDVLHKLRLKTAPLGLVYGAHCPPEIRVRLATDAAGGQAPLPIGEVGAMSGAKLGAAPIVPDSKRRKRRRRDRGRDASAASAPAPPITPPLPEAPYRSLAFYDWKDRALFTGRDTDVVRFAATLDRPDTRILILHGESGTGKSSFLRAGVVPYLEEECVGYRFFRRPDGAVLIVQAAKDLVGQLAQALLDISETSLQYETPDGRPLAVSLRRVLDEALGASADYAALREALRRDPRLLADLLARMAGRLPHALVLVLDQAEEVFTLARTPEEAAHNEHALQSLQRLVDLKADVKLIVSLRTEYYGRLLDHLRAGRRDLTGVRDDLLRDFSRSALIKAIERPTSERPLAPGQPSPREKYGFHYAEGIPALIAESVLALRSENQDSVLPLVQVICTQLYERETTRPGMDGVITREDLDAIKGVEGGLKAFAEDALVRSLRLGPADRASFKALFSQLYNRQPDGTLTTWLMPRESLEGKWDRPTSFADLLEAAKSVRLLREDELRIEGGESRRYVRLGHDALAKVADAWKAEVEERERRERERAERRKLRLRLLSGSLAAVILALVFGALWVKAGREAENAKTAEKRARSQADLARAAGLKAAREADNARTAEMQARAQEQVSRARLASSVLTQADTLWQTHPERGKALLLDPANFPPESRDFAWGYYYRLCDRVRVFAPRNFGIRAAAFSKDGKTLALGGINSYVGSWDWGYVQLMDTDTGKREDPRVAHAHYLFSLAMSPDGRTFATSGGDGLVVLWDTSRLDKAIRTFEGHRGIVRSVAFSPDGGTIASAGEDGTIRLWNTATGGTTSTLTLEGVKAFDSVAFSPDGNTIASSGDDWSVRLWDVKTHEVRETLKGHNYRTTSLSFNRDGNLLASGSEDGTVRLWDVESHKVRVIDAQQSGVRSVAFSPDGATVASGGADWSVRLWDSASGRQVAAIEGHRWPVACVAFSPDGQTLATGSDDPKSLRLLDLSVRPVKTAYEVPGNLITSAAYSPDGDVIATGSQDHTVRLWDAEDGVLRATLRGHEGPVWSVAYSPKAGRLLASAGGDGTVRLWDANSGEPRARLAAHQGNAWATAFSPDGTTLASVGGDRAVRLWNLGARQVKEEVTLEPDTRDAVSVAFSPDGKTLATGSVDGAVRLWDAATLRPRSKFSGHEGVVISLAFSPDGAALASGSYDETVRIWTVADSDVRVLAGHVGKVMAVAFSTDGQTLASGGSDRTIRLWDVPTGKEQRRLERGGLGVAHESEVTALAFSPDGARLASGSEDETVATWDFAEHEQLKVFQLPSKYLATVALSPDARLMASISPNAPGVWIRDATSGEDRVALKRFHGSAFAFSPDGRTLATGSESAIQLWDTVTGEPLTTPVAVAGPAACAAFSSDCKTVAFGLGKEISTDSPNDIILWDVVSPEPRPGTLKGHTGRVTSVAFRPDGKTLASWGSDRMVRLWDVTTGKPGPVFKSDESVGQLVYCPDGKSFITWFDRSFRRWDAETGKLPADLRVSDYPSDYQFNAIAFSHDKKTIAAGGGRAGRGGVIKLWDVSTGEPRATLAVPGNSVVALAFAEDGRTLVSVLYDQTILRWDAKFPEDTPPQ